MSVSSFKDLASLFVNNTFNDFTKSYVFEKHVETSDGQGGFTVAWSTHATVTSFVKTANANEIILDAHIKTKDIKKFSFEYVAGIKTDMRILYDGDYYNIHSVQSIQDSTIWIDVLASKAVAV